MKKHVLTIFMLLIFIGFEGSSLSLLSQSRRNNTFITNDKKLKVEIWETIPKLGEKKIMEEIIYELFRNEDLFEKFLLSISDSDEEYNNQFIELIQDKNFRALILLDLYNNIKGSIKDFTTINVRQKNKKKWYLTVFEYPLNRFRFQKENIKLRKARKLKLFRSRIKNECFPATWVDDEEFYDLTINFIINEFGYKDELKKGLVNINLESDDNFFKQYSAFRKYGAPFSLKLIIKELKAENKYQKTKVSLDIGAIQKTQPPVTIEFYHKPEDKYNKPAEMLGLLIIGQLLKFKLHLNYSVFLLLKDEADLNNDEILIRFDNMAKYIQNNYFKSVYNNVEYDLVNVDKKIIGLLFSIQNYETDYLNTVKKFEACINDINKSEIIKLSQRISAKSRKLYKTFSVFEIINKNY